MKYSTGIVHWVLSLCCFFYLEHSWKASLKDRQPQQEKLRPLNKEGEPILL